MLRVISTEFFIDKVVSSISIGFTNADSATYEVYDSADVLITSGILSVSDYVNTLYIPAVTCRKVLIILTSMDVLYLGGLFIGDPLIFQYHQVNPDLDKDPRGNIDKTNGGQVLGRNYKALRKTSCRVISLSESKRKEIMQMIETVGVVGTVYFDLYENNHDVEKPMYATLDSYGGLSRESKTGLYTMNIKAEEAR